tara:strand:- start:656 stop:1072 length:417 start_codon:yes stop_codon:yes gene_type:complete
METEAVTALNTFGEQSGLSALIAEYTWLLLVGFILLFLKGSVESAVQGLLIYCGSEYKEDDVVIVSGRPARIVRIGLTKTIFYLYTYRDGKIVGGTKMQVPNMELGSKDIEKPLTKLETEDFWRSGEGPNGHHNEEEE